MIRVTDDRLFVLETCDTTYAFLKIHVVVINNKKTGFRSITFLLPAIHVYRRTGRSILLRI